MSAPGLRFVRPPFVSMTPALAPAPALGQDTAEVLARGRLSTRP
jgi:hypothetical protein